MMKSIEAEDESHDSIGKETTLWLQLHLCGMSIFLAFVIRRLLSMNLLKQQERKKYVVKILTNQASNYNAFRVDPGLWFPTHKSKILSSMSFMN